MAQERWYSTAEIEAVPAYATLRTFAEQHTWDMHIIDKAIVLIPPYGDPTEEATSFDCEYDLKQVDEALAYVQQREQKHERS